MASTSTPSSCGSCPARSPSCPRAPASRDQRQPDTRSAPISRSRPPPSRSASTSRLRRTCRAAVNANPAASVETPTPPEPPINAITRPGSARPSGQVGHGAGQPARALRQHDDRRAERPPTNGRRQRWPRPRPTGRPRCGGPTAGRQPLGPGRSRSGPSPPSSRRPAASPGSLTTVASTPAAAMIDNAWSSRSGSAVTSTIPGSAYALGSIPGVCGSGPSAYRPQANLWIVIHRSLWLWTSQRPHWAPVSCAALRKYPECSAGTNAALETDGWKGLSKRA